jgi:hypothetical protein
MKNTTKFGQNQNVLGFVIVSVATTLGIVSLSMLPAIATPSTKHQYAHAKTAKPSHPGKFHRSPWSWQHWDPRIAPIQSTPDGKTYGQWAAEWWKWALKIPKSKNPVLLEKGDCRVGQKGQVWFLAGTLAGDGKAIERECQVPRDTKLFFPLINYAYFAFPLTDPPETLTEEFSRSQVVCAAPTRLEASIDGIPVKNPLQYFAESPFFKARLPKDDAFDIEDKLIPDGRVTGTDNGYYLFVQRLRPGKHTIKWKAEITCGTNVFKQDNSYNITVKSW